MKVELGVIDMPYDYGEEPGKTTHQVAMELEDEYKLFTHFFELHRDEIFKSVVEEIQLGLINHIKYGAPFDQETILLGKSCAHLTFFGTRRDGWPLW